MSVCGVERVVRSTIFPRVSIKALLLITISVTSPNQRAVTARNTLSHTPVAVELCSASAACLDRAVGRFEFLEQCPSRRGVR